jgi:5'-nucleotidase/UDP-sugar diphosphatase
MTIINIIKATFTLFVCFCISNAFATTEKAHIVFTAELNEIVNQENGSYAELASLLAMQREKTTPTFFIFGGASLFPSVLSSFDQGAHIIDLLNSLEPDVMAASKADFAFSEDELSFRTYEAAFPIVQSNIVEKETKQNLDGLFNSIIIEQGAYKFGFISIIDESVIETYNLTRIKVNEPRLAIISEAKKLRQQGVDFIIMHYQGLALNSVDFLKKGLVDIILRKNNHIKLLAEHPRQIILTESNQAAVVELSWQKNKPDSLTLQWQAKAFSDYPKNKHVEQQVNNYNKQLSLLLDEVIGISTTEIDVSRQSLRSQENGFANVIADLIKKHSSADIALINGGSIRSNSFYPKNSKISRRDILEILPFRNTVTLLDVTGAQLIGALENGFSKIESLRGRFPHVAGMKVNYDSQATSGQRVVSVQIDNKQIEPLRHYKLATVDYIANGGDGYLSFKENKALIYNQQMSKLVSDIIISELRLTNQITPQTDSRIVDIGKKVMETQ